MTELGFHPTENFAVADMASFMRQPELYWPTTDALAPQPADMRLEEYLTSQWVWTLACCYNNNIIGYVQLNTKTSIGAEFHTGFHPNCRGRIAKVFVEYAITRAFTDKGLLKLWALIASDNRPAILGAKSVGFVPEGRLTKAIMRSPSIAGRRFPERWSQTPGLRDIVILGLTKETVSG